MKKIQKTKPEIYDEYSDEIDLFELFQKIWKWKWLILAIMLVACIMTFLYVKSNPNIYTSSSIIRVGKIAGVPIEQNSDFYNYLISDEFQVNKLCSNTNIIPKANTETVEIKCTSNLPDNCFQCIENINKIILLRHKMIYEKASKKFNDYIAASKTKMEGILGPIYFLDTYTFPSSIIKNSEKSGAPDSKKLPVKMAVAIFASLFFGIFLAFFIEYILTHMKEKKK